MIKLYDVVQGERIMPAQTESYRVTINSLNIREKPTSSCKVFGQLKANDVIEKIAESDDGKWVKLLWNGVEGWSSKRYLKKQPYIPPLSEDFAWISVAEMEIGVHEIPGSENHPRVVEYLNSTTNLDKASKSKDETPWCSAFVNWCLTQAGYEGTNSALARSWLKWGQAITEPRKGCIVVFTREKLFGHVAFYLDETDTHIKVLGGNQLNFDTKLYEVSEKYYPKTDLLGYRIP
jgi:uncharacterized protein (TIGR02594 family)